MTVTQAVCLVGGRGTRLGALTDSTPKPLLEVGGRPFLDYLVHEARRFGLSRLTLLSGYQSGEIERRYHGQRFGQLAVEVVPEPEPAGTAGALANAGSRLDDAFFLLNGDSYFDFNWLSLVTATGDWTMHTALASGIEGSRYGRVQLEGGKVRGFQEKGASDAPINAGIYLVKRQVLDLITAVPCSLEREILPGLAERGQLLGTAARGSFIDIGIPSDFARAQTLLPSFMHRPAAFLDRDGILNRDDGYVHKAEDIVWIDGAIETVRWLNERGFYVFVITNQGGVAHGYYEEQHVHDLHDWMQQEMQRHGAHIDAFEHCPYHPEGKVERYARESEFRKPRPGMILKLQREWTTDPSRSFVVGDRDTDVEAAIAAGVAGFKFPGGNLLDFLEQRIPLRAMAPS
ncbi:MAG: HAD-IIIA family hydrolase [Reyranella sp.]|uniref:HAD-IIIA family hydrolase n=1 Tax=Reyranella sp. TaxID=1929291 RepID=UPI001AD3C054|nr:HAD-IIIA family hydrolase [Reyranella sp.]MBN9089187.1 HAD-IIIA family hydrolase [Reyranella sp.]